MEQEVARCGALRVFGEGDRMHLIDERLDDTTDHIIDRATAEEGLALDDFRGDAGLQEFRPVIGPKSVATLAAHRLDTLGQFEIVLADRIRLAHRVLPGCRRLPQSFNAAPEREW